MKCRTAQNVIYILQYLFTPQHLQSSVRYGGYHKVAPVYVCTLTAAPEGASSLTLEVPSCAGQGQ